MPVSLFAFGGRDDRFRLYARVVSALVVFGGVLVAIGWALDVRIPRIPYSPATMSANAAVAFMFSGLAVGLSSYRRARVAVAVFAAVAIAVGTAVLARGSAGMSPIVAGAFIVLGAAILLCIPERTVRLGHVLATIVVLFASVVCLGYLYGVQALYGGGRFGTVPVHAASMLLLLGLALLFSQPTVGLMPAIASDTIGAAMARRILPVAILVPIAVGGLWLWGARVDIYTLEIGVASVVVSMILVLSFVIWWSAGDLSRTESERRAAVDETRALNAELNARVVERTAQLEAANKELEAFSYSVSHDLRAPLRHIDGFSKILVDDYTDHLDPRAQRYLALIRSGAVTMGRMIDDLLQMARVDRRDLSFQEIDLNDVVTEVVDELRAETGDRVIDWQIEPLPVVVCDPGLIKLVFSNLLSNAVKYTRHKERGHIRVACEPGSEPPVFIVQDNGTGFDPRYADKLFGVFQRLHRAEDFEGTGIGLATVQRIVQKHGGRVWADAALDQGATFSFTLAAPAPNVDSDTLEPRSNDAREAGGDSAGRG
jgi:signal transduction histidine kinase